MDTDTLFAALGSIESHRLIDALERLDHPSQIRNADGLSIVLACVFVGRGDLVEAIAQRWPDLSLHEAAATGNAARVEALIAAGTDALNLLSADGWTALHLAAHLDHSEIVKQLLEAGAQPTIFSRAFEKNLPLHAACAGRSLESIRLLAAATPDVDVRVGGGFTALMETAYQGQAAAIPILLAAGADPALENDDGKSALDLARDASHEAVVALLT